MVLDLVHYRLYKEVIEYQSLPVGCREYFNRKEKQMMDFLLQKAKQGVLSARDKSILKTLVCACASER